MSTFALYIHGIETIPVITCCELYPILFSFIDPCLNSPCQNGGMCTAQEGLNYTCNCSSAGNFVGENCNSE